MEETLNKILIRGLEASACHGVHDEEKKEPQTFIFDADLYADFSAAAKSDDIEGTVNYSKACDILVKTATENSFNLIETLAYSGVYALFAELNLKKVTLTVYKPQAPVKHKFGTVGVSVTVEKERVYLSLGSSVGDKKKYLDTAVKALRQNARDRGNESFRVQGNRALRRSCEKHFFKLRRRDRNAFDSARTFKGNSPYRSRLRQKKNRSLG